jgi:UDP-glucose-4-epimerase GalE
VVGDLGDAATASRVLADHRPEVVMHFAACTYVGESVKAPLVYYRNNVANTNTLLACMVEAGVKRFVFSSSCAVYGTPETLPMTEDLQKDQVSPYGRTKWIVEQILGDAAVAHELGSISLRYFNAAGASSDAVIGEDHDPETHLIPLCIFAATGAAKPLTIFGDDYDTPDGTCVRDYVHVEDLADAHCRAIDAVRPGAADAYNLGTGNGNSVREVIDAVQSITGREVPHSIGPCRDGDPPALYADATRARETLGWQPKFTALRDTVQTAWDWHRTHERGYDDRS